MNRFDRSVALHVCVCGVGHLGSPVGAVLQGLLEEGCGVSVDWSWSWCDGCHSRWVGSCDVDVHHGRVGAGLGVDILVVWVVYPHLATVDYRWSQGITARVIHSLLVVEMIAQSCNAVAGEDAKDVALVIVKFLRSFTAETQEFVAKESLHAREREMCEFWAVVQQYMNTLDDCQQPVERRRALG